MAKAKKETTAQQQERLLMNLDSATNPNTSMYMPGQWQRLIAETLAVLLERSYVDGQ